MQKKSEADEEGDGEGKTPPKKRKTIVDVIDGANAAVVMCKVTIEWLQRRGAIRSRLHIGCMHLMLRHDAP
jgi:hypothetical protein